MRRTAQRYSCVRSSTRTCVLFFIFWRLQRMVSPNAYKNCVELKGSVWSSTATISLWSSLCIYTMCVNIDVKLAVAIRNDVYADAPGSPGRHSTAKSGKILAYGLKQWNVLVFLHWIACMHVCVCVCVSGGIERTRIRVDCIAYAFALNRKRSVRNVFDEKASLHGQSTASLCT